MNYRIWLSGLLLVLSAGAGYADQGAGKMRMIKLVEYRTQLSNLETPAGKVFEIYANKKWQRTTIMLHKGEAVIISYLSGKWRGNPSQEGYDARGCPGTTVDDDSYVLKFVNEGALCGRIGKKGEPFYVGNTREIIAEEDGELFLITNDDINQQRGAGYDDNSGYLNIVVYELSALCENAEISFKPQVKSEEKKIFGNSGISIKTVGSFRPVNGFYPDDACRLLGRYISQQEDRELAENSELVYQVSRENGRFRGKECYSVTIADRCYGEELNEKNFIVCANGNIFRQDDVKDDAANYNFVFSVPSIPLFKADGVMLSDPPDDQLTYLNACKRLEVKLFIADELQYDTMVDLAYLYQGIMDYQGKECYIFSLSRKHGENDFGVLCDYLVDGNGKILKGVSIDDHIVWEPLS